jgi:iron complex transport system permease protein
MPDDKSAPQKNSKLIKPISLGRVFLVGIPALLCCVVLATMLGAVPVSLLAILRSLVSAIGIPSGFIDPADRTVILLIRLPRVAAAVLAGGGLAISGTVMQGIFRNPLAEPGILGVSAGASLGALVAITTSAASYFILPFYAFLGAMLAVGVILTVAMFGGGRAGTLTLIMSGMAVGALFGAMTSLTLTAANQYQVSSYIFWTMGGLANRRWENVLAILPFVTVTIVVISWKARDLDILLLGDEQARALGVPPGATRLLLILLASVCTASIVSMTGPIGFVGLIVPHIMRMLVGPSHRILAAASAFGGAIFLVLCDLLTRLLAWPTGAELSAGIVTALVGAPYFLFLLFKSSKRGGQLT